MSTRKDFLEKIALGGLGGIIASGTAPAYIKNLKVKERGVSLEEAQDMHNRCLIFDCHNDTTVERVARGKDVSTMMSIDRDYHTDVPRMKSGGYDAASFIVGNGRIADVWVTIQQTLSMIESNPNDVILIKSSQDIIEARNSGKIGILMSIEGIAKWIMGKPDILRVLHRLGVRWVSITHGEGGSEAPEMIKVNNPLWVDYQVTETWLQGSRTPSSRCTPQERAMELKNAIGLTSFGKEILKINNELNIITDLAHTNDRTFFDVLEQTNKPVVVSHTDVFSLTNHYRNLTDDQIKELAANGGVMGCMFVPYLLEDDPEKANIDSVVKHIAYVADLVGVDYVGIGSDYDGITGRIILDDVSQLVRLTQSMMEYGFSEIEIKKIWGGNTMRILEQNIG